MSLATGTRTGNGLFVALGEEEKGLGVALGRLEQALAVRVLATALEDGAHGVGHALEALLLLLRRLVLARQRAHACVCMRAFRVRAYHTKEDARRGVLGQP
jgi:hypothetical protein